MYVYICIVFWPIFKTHKKVCGLSHKNKNSLLRTNKNLINIELNSKIGYSTTEKLIFENFKMYINT